MAQAMPLPRGKQRLAQFYIEMPALRPGTVGAYAFAFTCAAAALALRLAIDPYVVGVQYITFFPAVILTTLISGFRAGLLCVVLSAAVATFFALPQRLTFYVEHPAEGLAPLLFILVTLSNVILIAGMRFLLKATESLAISWNTALKRAARSSQRFSSVSSMKRRSAPCSISEA
jgi:K+-sensing histidine kinase KdpD